MNSNLEFLKKAKKVYFVAMKEELDPSYTSSEVVFTGVGKARASRALLKWIMAHRQEMELWAAQRAEGKECEAPLIVSIGTAGSGKFKRGDIVFVEEFVNNGDSFLQERICFDVLPQKEGRCCASSDFFICDETFGSEKVAEMRRKFDCMDMESFALANICKIFGLDMVAIKCISDGADDNVETFDMMLPKFRAKLNAFVSSLDEAD